MRRTLILALACLLALSPAALRAQNDIETESITEQGTLDPFSADPEELRTIFDRAVELFRSFEQPDSVALFDRLIARLESDHARGPLPEDMLGMLIDSRAYRAEARFNVGESAKVNEDFERILELDPTWRIDPDMVSPKLVDVFDKLRRESIGEILVRVEPFDATVTIAGRPIEVVGQPTAAPAGSQTLRITRPGFEPIEETVEIRAARSTSVEYTLERSSLVAHVRVRPAGTTVLVDGAPARVSRREPLADEPGEELAIDGLQPGRHILEFRLAEHRPFRAGFEAAELADYRLEPVTLEVMRGEVRLGDLPSGAGIRFDGVELEPTATTELGATFTLAPGDYLVEVDRPGLGAFRERVSLGDREVVDLSVRLQPKLAFLGVLGADRLSASELAARLAATVGGLPDWLWSDESIAAAAVLDAAGLDAAEMRRLAGLASRRAAPDWAEIRGGLDDRFGASIYLLAVLTDDLYASRADLWLWSAAPWPAAPAIRSVEIEGSNSSLESLVAAFGARAYPSFVEFGARFIEAGEVVVGSIEPGGPAAAAGLAPGDRILEIAGSPVSTLDGLRERARDLVDREASILLRTEPTPREARIRVAERPGILSLADPTTLDPVVAARLALALQRADGDAPRWLLELNRAAIHLRAMDYEPAISLLRAIDAPKGPGLGQAMVDYWLASALMGASPRRYAEDARRLFELAREQSGARLYHADGPLLAPRAAARIAALERSLRE